MKFALVAILTAVFLAQQPRDASVAAVTGTGAVSGVVLRADTSGAPVPAAIVTITSDVLPQSRSVVTDDQGRFEFAGLPAGRFALSAKKAAYLVTTFGAKRPGDAGVPVMVAAGARVTDLTLKLPRGAVITGRLVTASGAPAATIRVAAVAIGTADPFFGRALAFTAPITDERGQFRIYGLEPGEYLVAAAPSTALGGTAAEIRGSAEVDAIFERLQQRSQPGATPSVKANDSDSAWAAVGAGYAPIFYPGTAVASEAQRIRVSVGEERGGVDFVLRTVPVATIQGVISYSGGALPPVSVSIVPADSPVHLPLLVFGSTVRLAKPPDAEGRFTYANVPPGRYTISAVSMSPLPAGGGGRSGAGPQTSAPAGPALWAMDDVVVGDAGAPPVQLALQPPMHVRGRVTADAAPASAIDVTNVRVQLLREGPVYNESSNGTALMIPSPGTATVASDGSFDFVGVFPGSYTMNAFCGITGWRVRSAISDGRDMLDLPLVIGRSSGAADLAVTVTNRHSELTGVLQTPPNVPAANYVIFVFPEDRALWRATSRRIASARPATDGQFSIRDLPAGPYRVAALTDIDLASAGDPALLEQVLPASLGVTITDGAAVRQDIRVAAR